MCGMDSEEVVAARFCRCFLADRLYEHLQKPRRACQGTTTTIFLSFTPLLIIKQHTNKRSDQHSSSANPPIDTMATLYTRDRGSIRILIAETDGCKIEPTSSSRCIIFLTLDCAHGLCECCALHTYSSKPRLVLLVGHAQRSARVRKKEHTSAN